MQLHQNTVDSHACIPEAQLLAAMRPLSLSVSTLYWKGRLQHCAFNCKRMHLSVNPTTFNIQCWLLAVGQRTVCGNESLQMQSSDI